jgi:hypothetical protein
MLIQRSDSDYDKISGRAIIWTLDDGMVFMDRVYTVNDSDVELFKMYAKQKGWAYKYGQNSMESESIIYKDETIKLPKLKKTLKGSYNLFIGLLLKSRLYVKLITLRLEVTIIPRPNCCMI